MYTSMGACCSRHVDDKMQVQYCELFLNNCSDKESERLAFMDTEHFNELIGLKSYYGLTGIHYATQDGHCKVVKRLLDMGVNVNIACSNGITPLHCTTLYENSEECITLLLKYGANPNTIDIYGTTPLHYASENGYYNCIELLITAGAELNRINRDSKTPLDYALENGHKRCVKLLKDAGANKSYRPLSSLEIM